MFVKYQKHVGVSDVFRNAERSWGSAEVGHTKYEPVMFAMDPCDDKNDPCSKYQVPGVGKGQLQFDLWNRTPKSGRHDWAALKAKIAKHVDIAMGVRYSKGHVDTWGFHRSEDCQILGITFSIMYVYPIHCKIVSNSRDCLRCRGSNGMG